MHSGIICDTYLTMAATVDTSRLTWWFGVLFTLFTVLTISTTSLPDPYRVAALFEPEYESMELAFKYAMQKMNLRNIIGPSRLLIFQVEQVTPHDSFEASKEVCRQIKEGIAAVFGPIKSTPRAHVQSICNAFEIPHLQAQWDARDVRDYFSISVYPDYMSLSTAYADLIKEWKWSKFTVIYEDNDGLIRLQEVLKLAQGANHKVTVRKLAQHTSGYITMFKDLKAKNEYQIVIDCHSSKVKSVLHEALKVNMLSEYYHFHFTTLDLGLVDLEDYKYGGANITAMRLIDPARPEVLDVMSEWSITESNNGKSPLLGHPIVPTETALMYDAVQLFALGLKELAQAQDVVTEPLSCNKKQTWLYGNSLLNYMKSMDFEGLSGRIRFENGKRRDFTLDITELTQQGLKKSGYWNSKEGVVITTTYKEKQKADLDKLANKTLRVVTVYEEPYLMLRSEPDEKGRMHEGFMIDLLDLIAKKLKFDYVVYEVPDRKYGAEVEPGKWNGMVGELMHRDSEKRADLAAAGMTITYKREEVVDFTKPFLNLGITIIYKKPIKTPPELFSFLSPLSIDVWVYMLAAYLCVSFMLFVIARFSPYEWTNPHPCNEDSDVVENQFTILNSLWFTIGSLMQQGSDVAPRTTSTRIIASIWYLFTLILVSSYTANLAAFLTVERMDTPIENVDDLSQQTAIKYGTMIGGSTYDFFKKSDLPTYKRMWSFMQANPEAAFVNSSAEGFERVKTSDYAYLAESTTIDYTVQRNCELDQVGGLLDSKGYGIATPKDSPWREYLSNEVIYFQETQKVQALYTKWWKEKSGGKCVVEEKKVSSALEVANVGGVFVVLIGGMVVGFLIALLEFLWKSWKNARVDKQSFCSEVSEEIRFAVRCFGGSKKSVKRTPSKDIVDNGIQFAPLTGIPNNRNPKELYA